MRPVVTPAVMSATIGTVWIILFGGAYLSRRIIGLSRPTCIAIITAGYAVLAAAAVGSFGLDRSGYAGAFGMMLPYGAGIVLVLLLPGRRRHVHS